MAELQAAVDMKPGSYVNLPVLPSSVRMSITSGPNVPGSTGNVTGAEPSEKESVAVRSVIVRPCWQRQGQARTARGPGFSSVGVSLSSLSQRTQLVEQRAHRGVVRLDAAGDQIPQIVVRQIEQPVQHRDGGVVEAIGAGVQET